MSADRGAIGSHTTPVVDVAWDGPGQEAKIPNDAGASVLRRMYAWIDPDKDADTKAAYKFPHHMVTDGRPGAANLAGCRAIKARVGNADIPDADRNGVRAHADHHLAAAAASTHARDELRAAITAAHERGARTELLELQAEYRSLPTAARRELITADRTDPATRRRIMRAIKGGIPKPTRSPLDPGVLFGHYAVFNVWTEVDSFWEGHFMERIAPGAFTKTIAEDGDAMRVTLNHGRDPMLGDKFLGPIDVQREDKVGTYYEVPLFRSLPELVVEGLRSGLYGASFRFWVNAEELVAEPDPSAANPKALPERTITEAQVEEFGPVSWPQYPEASAILLSASTSSKRATPSIVAPVRHIDREEFVRKVAS